jgi:murein DD-endopeptidase MepM/ murein hydrolase activator NlpD
MVESRATGLVGPLPPGWMQQTMARTRYTIVIADRGTGTVRRLTVGLRVAALSILALFSLPILIGLGARWSAVDEINGLRNHSTSLEVENTSYRAATEALTSQIQTLQAAVDDIGAHSRLDPAAAKAMERLPATVKIRAVGGGRAGAAMGPTAIFTPSLSSPDDTFGVLRDVLKGLERHLTLVKRDVERREALAAALPTIWPLQGWLSGGYGMRTDPFTGQPDFHPGLDISADKGRPVYATADGTVETAARVGDYGNLIVLRHGFGIVTRYGHLSLFAVRVGERVVRGQLIGYVGATGRATGPHLHYEVAMSGRLLNPLQFLFSKPGA